MIKLVAAETIFPEYLDSTKAEHGINPRTYMTWIANVLATADIPYDKIKKTAKITVKDFRGVLPCDLELIDQVQYQGKGMSYSSNTISDYHDPDSTDLKRGSNMTYSINQFPIINPFFRDGDLFIYYWAIPSDNKGFPLIPDNVHFKEACIRYFTMKNKYARYAADKITFNEYYQAEQHYNEQIDKAISDMAFPDPERWYGIATRLMRMIPTQTDQFNMFNV
jgi:hypothetical protein